ncbi:hypothetical protein CN570_29310 [Bacillus toyonensis]|uniref:DUF5511 family protein n=1 Tax=Bacillus cereus group sp. N17 TaxID=2794589 RepID=UPI00033019CE|nr:MULTISPECIES: DUF5511 family protein [Bacillus cereus group]EOP20056.1 hypothetical protein IIS_05992 [Bacillus cereus VD131]MBJ8044532.1 DUF5511 family protein [Bacillus cereus group sp. N17]PEJ00614.1 hypothetical protein CN671_19180 [Bacillus toyonensis]PEO73234.1 hypothetical protein CN570_29310 [Bacillus toyonensis]TBX54441.1 hypothetical protein E0M28_30225 [Bacillus toyonensis]
MSQNNFYMIAHVDQVKNEIHLSKYLFNKQVPIRYMEEKKIEDGELRFNPVEEIVNDQKGETEEVFQMESVKMIGSVKTEHGAIEEVQESKTIPDVGKRYVGKDTIHEEEKQQISQTREEARKHYMMKHMLGRNY